MAKKPAEAGENEEKKEQAPFENQPSELDELTHLELRLMHGESADAVLFAKNVQWRLVGGTMLIFAAMIAVGVFARSNQEFEKVLAATSIVLTCGVIFILTMYQFWQFNEFTKMNEIEKNFSSLFKKIRKTQMKRTSGFQRYTLLLAMIMIVLVGAVVANLSLQ